MTFAPPMSTNDGYLQDPDAGEQYKLDHRHGRRFVGRGTGEHSAETAVLGHRQKALIRNAPITRCPAARIGARRPMAQLLGVRQHPGQDGQRPVEDARPVAQIVAPAHDVGSLDAVQRYRAEHRLQLPVDDPPVRRLGPGGVSSAGRRPRRARCTLRTSAPSFGRPAAAAPSWPPSPIAPSPASSRPRRSGRRPHRGSP